MTNKVLHLIYTVLLLFGCNDNGNGKFERQIENQIDEICHNEVCTINLSEITYFKWNKLFVFKETSSLETVEDAINQQYPYYSDIAKRYVFIDEDNKIVYHEEIFPNVEGIKANEIIFDIPDSLNFRSYTNPFFIVLRRELKEGHYYILSQKEFQ